MFKRKLITNLIAFLILIVFFLLFFKLLYGSGTASKMDNLFRFNTCLELLEEGKLYSQYACWHGPIVYYTYYLFKVIFGSYFVLASSVILNALLLFLILYLIWKETNTNKFVIPSLLYLALIVPLIMDFFSLAAELVASVYMLLGIILLLYWKSRAKLFFVSLLLTLAILSEQVTIFPVVFFIIFYLYKIIGKPKIKNALNLVKNNKLQLLWISLPVAILHVIFELIHKNFIRFVWLGFVAAKSNSLFDAITQTITKLSVPNLVTLPLTIMLVISLYSLFKARNIYLNAFFISFITFVIINVRAYPIYDLFDVYLFYSNKFMMFIVLFIIGFSIFTSKINFNVRKAIIFSLFLSALLYPGLDKLHLYKQTNDLEDLVMAPLGLLGKHQTILSNDDKFTRYETKYKNLDLLPNLDLSIGIKNEFNFHDRWVNLSEERNRVNVERWRSLLNFRKRVAENAYSMLVYGPDTTELDLYYVITDNSAVVDNYCSILLPTTEHKCTLCKNTIRVFFRENETCGHEIPRIVNYYSDNFYKICRFNELTANLQVRGTMAVNGFFILDKCENGGTLLSDYNDKAFGINDFFNILYLALLIIILVLFNFDKKLTWYAIGLLIILLLPLYILNNNFVSEYSLNETSYAYTNKSVFGERFPAYLKALETPHYASYYAPAEIGELEQKDLVLAGRYNNNLN